MCQNWNLCVILIVIDPSLCVIGNIVYVDCYNIASWVNQIVFAEICEFSVLMVILSKMCNFAYLKNKVLYSPLWISVPRKRPALSRPLTESLCTESVQDKWCWHWPLQSRSWWRTALMLERLLLVSQFRFTLSMVTLQCVYGGGGRRH